MKKIIFLFLLLLFSLSNTYAQFGIRAGVNMANEIRSFKNVQDNFKSDNLTAFHIGIVLQAPFKKSGFATEFALLYTQKGSFYEYGEDGNNQQKYNELNYVELPINLRFMIPANTAFNVYGTVGIYGAYMFNGRTIDEATQDAKKIAFTRSADRVDYGLSAGAGVRLFRKIQIGATWSWGLKDSKIPTIDDLKSSKNRVFSVNLTYLF
jgi:opacity protein-like surface antigen